MIYDLSQFRAKLPEYDVCIIGSGPAGIVLANELKNVCKICVLESGNMKPTKRGDDLRRVESEGIFIKEDSRERVFGGASTTWAGLSSVLDEVDMTEREFVPYSGWPITRNELLPYYELAAKRYRFPSLESFQSRDLAELRQNGDCQFVWKNVEEKHFLAFSEPPNYGQEFRDVFHNSRVDLFLDATVLRLESSESEKNISYSIVRTSGGQVHKLRAKIFVIATGGIENARILLNSVDHCIDGLGNETDQVGRYLMNHPKNYYGMIQLDRPIRELPYYFGFLFKGYAGYTGLKLRESIQVKNGWMNSYVRLEPIYGWSDNCGIQALVILVKSSKSLFTKWKQKKRNQVVSLRDYSETGDDSDLQNTRRTARQWLALPFLILINLPQVLRYLYYRLSGKRGPEIVAVRLRNFMEMAPDPNNRVVLGETKDAYGQPVPIVRHACRELDRRTMIELHKTLVDEFADNKFGCLITRLEYEEDWPINLDASHHMGTTRMGTDPQCTVVNTDCRLHSVANVYVAGASVFPTSGCANPTFTIAALSIRLAEYLKIRLGSFFPSEQNP